MAGGDERRLDRKLPTGLAVAVDIRRFRETTGFKVPRILMIGIGLIWAIFSLLGGDGEEETYSEDDYVEYDEEFEGETFSNDTDVEVRFVERELILLEAGEDRGWWIAWLTGQNDREKSLDQLAEVLDNHELDPKGSELLEVIDRMKSEGDGNGASFSDQEKDTMVRRLVLSESIWYLAILGALPAIWLARRDWRTRGKDWRILKAWWPSTVLTIFFVTSLVGEQLIFNLTSLDLYRLFGDDWGLVFTNLVWRGSAAVLAAFVLVGVFSGTFRVFLGKNAIRWKAVAGAFCVLAAFEAIRSQFGVESDFVDPTDYFLIADPRRFDLFFEFVDAAIFAPVFEELMFRGVLFLGLMRRTGAMPAALVSSLFFAVVHTQYDPWELISVGVFGLACCWLTWRTGSIKSSIVLHMIYNALVTAGVYLVYQMPL